MKKQASASFVKMSTQHLENLTTLVNETLATGIVPPTAKTFTVADLWNIQRQGKSRIPRRNSF